MPSTRVTLANNAKQTQRTILLMPDSLSREPTAPDSCRTLILKTAKTKFQSKKASRIFDSQGKELLTMEDWESAIQNDATILVSKHDEDFIGVRSSASASATGHDDTRAGKECPIVRLDHTAEIDPMSIKQLETTAKSLPGIIHAVAQPDLHPGNKFPIGGVFVSRGWLHPPLIGGDIGCGMAWYKLAKSNRSQVEGDKGKRIAERLRGLEGPWRTQTERELWLQGDQGSSSAGPVWDASLGTIGAGNHFAEIQVVEECKDEVVGMKANDVVLLVHSGSRGYGGDILKRFTPNGQESIQAADGEAYLEEHNRACRWASRNRDLIALRFLAILEPGEPSWVLGQTLGESSASAAEIQQALHSVYERKIVDIWHNNVERTSWPLRTPEHTTEEDISDECYIHRKGAAPTLDPQSRAPLNILPLPGSRATPTVILHPLITETNGHGSKNALSLAHGAGRARSRADAAKYIAEKYKGRADDLVRGDFVRADRQGNKKGEDPSGRSVHGGTWVVCEDKQLVWEEAGEAYKDVWKVADDLVESGVAEIWGWCRGRISYKVRKE